jgi:hypothetical protein
MQYLGDVLVRSVYCTLGNPIETKLAVLLSWTKIRNPYLFYASDSKHTTHITSCANQFHPDVCTGLDHLVAIVSELWWGSVGVKFDIRWYEL